MIVRESRDARMFSGGIHMVSPLRVDSRWSFVNISMGNSEIGTPSRGKTTVVPALPLVNHVS